jgi:3-hydroxyacyl-CoA dehydrogenase/enoyl-CoA hydratase/3-hydroxybutyryl-CoA epimerase
VIVSRRTANLRLKDDEMKHLQHLIMLRTQLSPHKGRSPRIFRKVGVIGAGLMGAGIAHVCARAGIEVILLDTTMAAARSGFEQIEMRMKTDAAKQKIGIDKVKTMIGRIATTDDFSQLSAVDLAIEAVYEDRDVKAEVTRKVEAVLPQNAIFATNTSTLPITELAEASKRPQQFIGLHFFSPVDRMPLLEIIRGQRTDDETLLASLDFASQIGKTPITVNDARGFYTTRIVIAYIQEANEMLAEGIDPNLIERAAVEVGMPLGPLALCDEVALSLMHQINVETKKALGKAYKESKGAAFLAKMVEVHKRSGRKAGGGYFDYPAEAPKRIWGGLNAIMPARSQQPDLETIKQRLIGIQVLEAIHALDEGVLVSPIDGDIGAMLGWGMPEDIGGPFTYVDRLGLGKFIKTCDGLRSLGERFAPPPRLIEMERRGAKFY